jgi:YegS/Rv2252/BmrU family lipid kinase
MAPPRTVLIINPQSQKGALGRKWPDLARAVRRELGSFEEARTHGPGDATRLAREAVAGGVDRVVAVGGDGTINEVVNGFFDHHGERVSGPAALGILPVGTGGDLRKTLAIPRNIDRAARILRDGRPRPMDVGKLEYTTRDGKPAMRMFANIASFGVSGVVDRLVNDSSKRLGGTLSFFVASVRATLGYTNQRVRLVFDDNPADAAEMTINTVAIANGRYFGGGMFIAPHAEVDDGYFDVIVLGDLSTRDLVLHGRRMYKGTHLSMDKVSHRRARVVRAEPIDPGHQGSDPGNKVELDVDGETPGVLPATFTLLPGAISVIVPAPGSR